MSVLLAILALVVAIMIYGVRMFGHTSLRQGLEGDARRISSRLKKDLALSDFHTVSVQERLVSGLRRDGVGLGSLSDWNDPSNFQAGLGLPRWNRYTVYYATQEATGRLVRQDIEPPGIPLAGWNSPYSALSSNLRDDPTLNTSVVSSTVLSSQVEHFECRADVSENTVTVVCRLREKGQNVAGTNKKGDESIQFRLLLKTKNTWPDI